MTIEFKLLSKVAKDSLKKAEVEPPVMCDYESTPMGFQKTEPFISDKHKCSSWIQMTLFNVAGYAPIPIA